MFENRLINNIKKITDLKDVKKLRGRFIIDYFENHHLLKNVFGLTSYSLAIKTTKDIEQIKKQALILIENKTEGKKTFRVETKRADKTFPLKSPELSIEIGKFIEENSNLQFKFKDQDITLYIEINKEGVYLFTEKVDCFGGLPTGVEGKVLLLVENESSLLAGLMFMKRGCSIIPIAFSEKEISLLQQYSPTNLSLEIIKDLSELEKYKNIYALVVGDNFDNLQEYKTDLLVFRPLIAFSDKDIEKELEKFN